MFLVYINNFCVFSYDIISPLGGICDKQVFAELLTILSNGSVDTTASDDKYVNITTYTSSFYYFLCFAVDLCILESLKCLMTFGSIETLTPLTPCYCGCLFYVFFMYM